MTAPFREETLGSQYAADREDMQERESLERLRAAAARVEKPAEEEEIEESSIGAKALESAKTVPGAVASDVLRGLQEVPLKLAAGVAETFTADPLDLLGDLFGRVESAERTGVESLPAAVIQAIGPEVFESAAGATREFITSVTAGPSDTVTGEFAKQIGNFTAAFVPILGQLGRGKQAATAVGRVNMTAVAGAITDFLTTDTIGEATLKARLEAAKLGAVMGVGLDRLVLFMRSTRAARRAAKKAADSGEVSMVASDLEPGVTVGQLQISGGTEAPLVKARGKVAAKRIAEAEAEIRARFGDTPVTKARIRKLAEAETTDVEINFDRINTAEDVEQLMQDATDLFKPAVEKARRGVRSNEATQEAADTLGVSLGELLSRRRGQALNAEEATAFRKVWVSAAEKVEELAGLASGPSAGETAQVNFRRGLAVFNAINQQVLGARAEAGRSLQAWSIKIGGDVERARLVSSLLDANGGAAVSKALAERITLASKMGMSPAQISKIAERGWGAKTLDAVKESFVLGLLWTPSTHMVNLTSNTLVPIQQITERAVARQIGRLLGDVPGEGIAPGEALVMFKGVMSGIRAAFHIGSQTAPLREQARASIASARGKVDIRHRAISSEAFGINPDNGLGKFVDFMGSATRIPGTALQIEDNFFKTIGFSGELEAQALRQASKEGAENGWTVTRIAERAGEIRNNPPEHIRLAAADAALYNTFQQDVGKFGRSLMNVRDAAPPAVLALPFIRTPMNLLRYTFERSPVAPLVGQWRADVAAGGARQEIALARMAVGSSVFAAMLDYAYEGHMSGPPSREHGIREARLRQGMQADSVRFGDTTFKINRVDPFGMQLSVAAGIAELMKTYQVEEGDIPELSEIIAAAAVMTSDAILDKTWFAGVSNMLSFMQDPGRRAPRFIEQNIQALVPFTTAIRTASALAEPTRPGASGWLYVEGLIDGFRKSLPRRRDLWGRTIEVDVVNVFSPARIDKVEENAIDTEILRLGADIRRIPRVAAFQGVSMNFRQFPKVYEAYVQLAGNDLDHPVTRRGAFDFLQELVSGRSALSPTYEILSDGPDGQKQAEIRRWISDYRKLAQDELMRDPRGRFQGEQFQEFRALVQEKSAQKNRLLLPGGIR